MDSAYDHIQEEVLRSDENSTEPTDKQTEGNLNTEIREAYKSFSASPWGNKLGGFFGSVKKLSESSYQGARQEAAAVSEEALKGFSDLKSTLVNRTRSLSTEGSASLLPSIATLTGGRAAAAEESEAAKKERSDSEALRESESLISRFRAEAAKRLKEIEKAEDVADEALLKFGSNIRNFFRDAVSIAPPTDEKDKDGNTRVLFESKDQDGKRVIHTTRFDAQLHVIHSSLDSFTKDPASPEYEKWKTSGFDVEKKTGDIAAYLEKYEELRRAMEKLVPEKVQYAEFWKRYFFLRMVIESEEQRRKELLKGANLSSVEEVGWDEDSDDEPSTPQPKSSSTTSLPFRPAQSTPKASTAISAPPPEGSPDTEAHNATPNEPRKSQDRSSQPDSDASYDLVSGATSRAPPSPRDEKERKKKGGQDSDEEDWE